MLRVVNDSFKTIPDKRSVGIEEKDFHPTMVTGRFVCLLRCEKCYESCAVAGNYNVDQAPDENDEYHEYEYGRPKCITPPPPLIAIPPKCPKAIKQEVVAAFSAYWSDYASSLNHIRQALELLLSDLGIPRTTISSSNKSVDLTLHSRIDKLKSRKPKLAEVCDRMFAVKHLGNAGSHPAELKADDVFDGFDILETVLHDTYSTHASTLAKMVKEINKRKGTRKGKR